MSKLKIGLKFSCCYFLIISILFFLLAYDNYNNANIGNHYNNVWGWVNHNLIPWLRWVIGSWMIIAIIYIFTTEEKL